MGQLPTNRTTGNTPAEHVGDHNELHRLHDVVDMVADLVTAEGVGPTVSVISKFGLSGGGAPYFDADGAVDSEEATLTVDPYTGALLVTKVNALAVSHDHDPDAHALVSPNGTRYRLTVANDGTLSAEAI